MVQIGAVAINVVVVVVSTSLAIQDPISLDTQLSGFEKGREQGKRGEGGEESIQIRKDEFGYTKKTI